MSKRRAVTQLPHLLVGRQYSLYSERRALDSCCHQSDPGLVRVVLNTCCVVGYTSKAGKDILIFHNSRASMDRDLHSEQPNVGSLRTYRSQSDLAYSYNRAMEIAIVGHV